MSNLSRRCSWIWAAHRRLASVLNSSKTRVATHLHTAVTLTLSLLSKTYAYKAPIATQMVRRAVREK